MQNTEKNKQTQNMHGINLSALRICTSPSPTPSPSAKVMPPQRQREPLVAAVEARRASTSSGKRKARKQINEHARATSAALASISRVTDEMLRDAIDLGPHKRRAVGDAVVAPAKAACQPTALAPELIATFAGAPLVTANAYVQAGHERTVAIGRLTGAVSQIPQRDARTLVEIALLFSHCWATEPLPLHPASGTPRFVVPRCVEVKALMRPTGVSSPTCVNRGKECEAWAICAERNAPHVRLAPFALPFGVMRAEQRCLLCIRRDVKLAVMRWRLAAWAGGNPSTILPFRNLAGVSGEHPEEVFFQFTEEEVANGLDVCFVEHRRDMYRIREGHGFEYVFGPVGAKS